VPLDNFRGDRGMGAEKSTTLGKVEKEKEVVGHEHEKLDN